MTGAAYIDEVDELDVDALWSELAGDAARPVVHQSRRGIIHLHLLDDASLAYSGETLTDALRAGVIAWRRAKCANAVKAGLLSCPLDQLSRDEVAAAAAAAFAVYEVRPSRP